MIKYMCWVGGAMIGAVAGIAMGAKFGYMSGVFLGDALYHCISNRSIRNGA